MIVNNREEIVANDAAVRPGGVDEVRTHLEAMILSGALQPGDRLNELSIASRLGISRSHVREAVRALEEARLVEVIANRGAHVRKLGFVEALELFDIRAGFARSAGRLAALRATRAQIKELEEIHRRMGNAATASNPVRFHELNLRFHAVLMGAAANARLQAMDHAVRNELQLYIRRNVSSAAQLRASFEEHGAILAALVAGDKDECGAAFESHILNGKLRLMDSGPTGGA